jgi:glycogen operon protein
MYYNAPMSFGDFAINAGKAQPMGATVTEDGVNFAIFSLYAQGVTLVLFESPAQDSPFAEIPLDKKTNKTGDIWHCLVRGLKAGAGYLYRADGPYQPEQGLRFNSHKALIDPYAKALTPLDKWDIKKSVGFYPKALTGDLSISAEDNVPYLPRCIVMDDNDFDWQGDTPLNYPLRFSILYETHVKGLTANPNSGVGHPGTYLGVIEKIPYLKELGVTSLEFLPIQEFNEHEFPRKNPKTGETLTNYWGYSTMAFFALI